MITLKQTVFGLATLALATSGASAASCLSSAEREAHQVRHLQTQLMVGALQCRGAADAGHRDNYNRFIKANSDTLVSYSKALTASFRREHGAAYRTHLDRYITGLANQVSLESQRTQDFCAKIGEIGEVMASGDNVDLAGIAMIAPIVYVPEDESCSTVEQGVATAE